jgi:hypothetical protein
LLKAVDGGERGFEFRRGERLRTRLRLRHLVPAERRAVDVSMRLGVVEQSPQASQKDRYGREVCAVFVSSRDVGLE